MEKFFSKKIHFSFGVWEILNRGNLFKKKKDLILTKKIFSILTQTIWGPIPKRGGNNIFFTHFPEFLNPKVGKTQKFIPLFKKVKKQKKFWGGGRGGLLFFKKFWFFWGPEIQNFKKRGAKKKTGGARKGENPKGGKKLKGGGGKKILAEGENFYFSKAWKFLEFKFG